MGDESDDSSVGCDNIDWTTEDEREIENFKPSPKCSTVPNGETSRDFQEGDDERAECDNIDWNTDDDLEIENFQPSPKCLTVPNGETNRDFGEGDDERAECDNIDWNTDDDLEIENFHPSPKGLTVPIGETSRDFGEGCSYSKVFDHFVGMGFPRGVVAEVIKKFGEDNEDKLLEELLTYSGDDAGLECEKFDWTTEDDLDIENFQPSSNCLDVPNRETTRNFGEGSSYAGLSNSKVFKHLVGMGFPGRMVAKVIEEYGEENEDKLLEELLTYSVLESSPHEGHQVEPDPISSEHGASSLDDFSDTDLSSDDEEINTLLSLINMGFEEDEALNALETLGPNTSLEDLVDFIGAAQFAKVEDDLLPPENKENSEQVKPKKRKCYDYEVVGKKRRKIYKKKIAIAEEEEILRLPNPMIGFGVPINSNVILERKIPLSDDAIGPPYFYYENVACAPKGVWHKMSKILYGVEPEFVDSKYFCAAARKRGYIHNLPIVNRFPLQPFQPLTIHEALPLTRTWWPSWDPRTKLNCLQTVTASAKVCERIRKALENLSEDGDPPRIVKKYVLEECRRWNLVWVGRNKVAPLEPDEIEALLGFQQYHTRGISRTDRLKSLGNSFQVDTVAYHLSVLKDMYPSGINVLSLFSGIGGAEVALHKLGIPLKNVVSVEKSEVNRNIVKSWWGQSKQKGNLVEIDDVRKINEELLGQLMSAFGAFDLVIGGSPCNNLAGSNRVSRDGLDGKESSLFYDYFRILHLVKKMYPKYQ